jgi:phage terminase small subunit
MALTKKRQAFVEAYLSGTAERFTDGGVRNSYLNATQAARQAGYAHPETEGSRLLHDDEVRAFIDKRMRDMEIRTEQIIAREFDVATGDMGDFADVFRAGNLPRMLDKAKELGISHLIKKAKEHPEQGVEIQLYDAHEARKLLGQRMGLWNDEERGFNLSEIPPVLFNIMSASASEVLEALDRLRKEREG